MWKYRWDVQSCDDLNTALSVQYDSDHPDDVGGTEHLHPSGWWAVMKDGNPIAYFKREITANWYKAMKTALV